MLQNLSSAAVVIGALSVNSYPTIDFCTEKCGLLMLMLVFNVPPTAKVIWRRGQGLKSHPTDW